MLALRPSQRGPCLVSFSGGRDSSLVLAAAAKAARRDGLALPVPVTNRFACGPHSHESDWQELVVAQARPDGLGPPRAEPTSSTWWESSPHAACAATGCCGRSTPTSTRPLLELRRAAARSSPGSAATSCSAARAGRARMAVLARARAPAPTRPRARGPDGGAAQAAHAWCWPAAPRRRSPGCARRPPVRSRAPGRRTRRASPRGSACGCGASRNAGRCAWALRSLDLLAADAGAAIAHPLLDPRVLAAVAAAGGTRRLDRPHRTPCARCSTACSPPELLARSSKAHFDGAFWGPRSPPLCRVVAGRGDRVRRWSTRAYSGRGLVAARAGRPHLSADAGRLARAPRPGVN